MRRCGGRGQSQGGYSALPKPSKGQVVVDPDFGTKLRRITDGKADWGSSVVVPAYPTIQAWNADESFLLLYVTEGSTTGFALFDGRTYAFLRWLDINPPDLEQFYWDTNEPDLLYFIDNTTTNSGRFLTRLHVSTGVKDHLHDFAQDLASGGALSSACSGSTLVRGGEDPFSISLNGDLFGLGCYRGYNGPNGVAMFGAFTYRVSTNTIGQSFQNEATVPQAVPSGKATYFYDGSSGVSVLDPVTNAVQAHHRLERRRPQRHAAQRRGARASSSPPTGAPALDRVGRWSTPTWWSSTRGERLNQARPRRLRTGLVAPASAANAHRAVGARGARWARWRVLDTAPDRDPQPCVVGAGVEGATAVETA